MLRLFTDAISDALLEALEVLMDISLVLNQHFVVEVLDISTILTVLVVVLASRGRRVGKLIGARLTEKKAGGHCQFGSGKSPSGKFYADNYPPNFWRLPGTFLTEP